MNPITDNYLSESSVRSWLLTTDHKRIGLLYLFTILIFFFIAACAAALMRLNLLTRAKPIFEQSLYVLVALLAYELLLWLIDGWTGHSMSSPLRWVHTVIGAMLWPVIVGMLGRFHTAR